MSVDVLQSPFQIEKHGWLAREEQQCHAPLEMVAAEDNKLRPDDQLDIWSHIQAEKVTEPPPVAPYLHPLVRRLSLSSMSLQICTERLGSETGSDDFTSLPDVVETEHAEKQSVEFVHEENIVVVDDAEERYGKAKETVLVNYHCSIGRRTPARCFPPPLRPCFKMRPHRRDGRLVIETVRSPSRKYLHARRENGRLILCFVEPASDAMAFQQAEERRQFEEDIMEENEADEKEEEGAEATVSTQPRQQGCGPASCGESVTTAATGATTAVATLGLGGKTEQNNEWEKERKLSLTSKRLDLEEMLRRCSELRGTAWFICDTCIATSY
ncbi:protein FAF-like, chloroplastic [Curcuma longa]|uniref:protein FAF-like, chloroplastic n=1 Tax=Curcuma longa TaxID=136217 RepID=UPI003D9F3243